MKFKKHILLIVTLFVLNLCCGETQAVDSQLNFNSAINSAAVTLKQLYEKEFSGNGRKKLAVLNFVNENGDYSVLGKFSANTIQPEMFSPKIFNMLERSQIESILQELKLNESGMVKTNEAKKIGEMAGADLVLVGTLAIKANDNGIKSLIITSKIVDVESSEVMSIATTTCKTTEEIIKNYHELLPGSVKSYAGAYKVTISNLIVKKTKKSNEDWDGDVDAYQPDLCVYYRTNKSDLYFSECFHDRFMQPEVVKNARIILEDEDNIILSVYDSDFIDDDFVGRTVISVSKIREYVSRKEPIKLSFDQVESVEILLEKI